MYQATSWPVYEREYKTEETYVLLITIKFDEDQPEIKSWIGKAASVVDFIIFIIQYKKKRVVQFCVSSKTQISSWLLPVIQVESTLNYRYFFRTVE